MCVYPGQRWDCTIGGGWGRGWELYEYCAGCSILLLMHGEMSIIPTGDEPEQRAHSEYGTPVAVNLSPSHRLLHVALVMPSSHHMCMHVSSPDVGGDVTLQQRDRPPGFLLRGVSKALPPVARRLGHLLLPSPSPISSFKARATRVVSKRRATGKQASCLPFLAPLRSEPAPSLPLSLLVRCRRTAQPRLVIPSCLARSRPPLLAQDARPSHNAPASTPPSPPSPLTRWPRHRTRARSRYVPASHPRLLCLPDR